MLHHKAFLGLRLADFEAARVQLRNQLGAHKRSIVFRIRVVTDVPRGDAIIAVRCVVARVEMSTPRASDVTM